MAPATTSARGACTRNAARRTSGSLPGAPAMARLTPCVPLLTTTLFTTFEYASAWASAPKSLSPTTWRRSGCWANPTTRKNSLAPSTATPPRPAVRASLVLEAATAVTSDPPGWSPPTCSESAVLALQGVVDGGEDGHEVEEEPDRRADDAGDGHAAALEHLRVAANFSE